MLLHLRLGCILSALLILLVRCTAEANGISTKRELKQHVTHAVVGLQQHEEWSRYIQQLAMLHVQHQPLLNVIGPALSHPFKLSLNQLRRATINRNANARLRHVVSKLMVDSQTNVTVGILGTKISWGKGASSRGQTDWASMLPQALRSMFPRANIKVHNGCSEQLSSIQSVGACVNRILDPATSYDLVIIEMGSLDKHPDEFFFANEPVKAYERALRRVLARQEQPALVLLHPVTPSQGLPSSSAYKRRYHQGIEDLLSALAQYYGLPALSMRNAVWHEVEAEEEAGQQQAQGQAQAQGRTQQQTQEQQAARAMLQQQANPQAQEQQQRQQQQTQQQQASPQAAASAAAATGVDVRWRWADLLDADRQHPSDLGHRVLLDLVMWLLHVTAVDCARQPQLASSLQEAPITYAGYQEPAPMVKPPHDKQAPLPPSMWTGNFDQLGDTVCQLGSL